MIKLLNIINESVDNMPMTWYHATTPKIAKEIMENGFKMKDSSIV